MAKYILKHQSEKGKIPKIAPTKAAIPRHADELFPLKSKSAKETLEKHMIPMSPEEQLEAVRKMYESGHFAESAAQTVWADALGKGEEESKKRQQREVMQEEGTPRLRRRYKE